MKNSKNIYKWLVIISLIVFISSILFGLFYFIKIKNRFDNSVFSFNYPENKKLSFSKKGVYFLFSENIEKINVEKEKEKGKLKVFNKIDTPKIKLFHNNPVKKIKVGANTEILIKSKDKGEISIINDFNKFIEKVLEGKINIFFIVFIFSFILGIFSLINFILTENKS